MLYFYIIPLILDNVRCCLCISCPRRPRTCWNDLTAFSLFLVGAVFVVNYPQKSRPFLSLSHFHQHTYFLFTTYRRHQGSLTCGWPRLFYLMPIYETSEWVQPLISSRRWIPWESRGDVGQKISRFLLVTKHPGDGGGAAALVRAPPCAAAL